MRSLSIIQSYVHPFPRPSAWGNPAEHAPAVSDDPDGPGVLVATSAYWPKGDPAFLAATHAVGLDVDGDGRADLGFVARVEAFDANGDGVIDRRGDAVRITVESARTLGILPLDVCGETRKRVVCRVVESI